MIDTVQISEYSSTLVTVDVEPAMFLNWNIYSSLVELLFRSSDVRFLIFVLNFNGY